MLVLIDEFEQKIKTHYTWKTHDMSNTCCKASDIQGFQKLMYDQTYKYSEIVFLQFQCVFRTGFYPQSCLVEIFKNWKVSLELQGCWGIPSIDLLETRDCIMHHLCVVLAIVIFFRFIFHKPLKYNRNTIYKWSQDSRKPSKNDRATSSGN